MSKQYCTGKNAVNSSTTAPHEGDSKYIIKHL